MKKFIAVFLIVFVCIGNAIAYSPSEADYKALEVLYKELDKINAKTPKTYKALGVALEGLKDRYKDQEKTYFMINKTISYIKGDFAVEDNYTSQVGDIENGEDNTTNNAVSEPVNNALNEVKYKVLKVVDGDTINIEYNGKSESFRLIGIDSPESSTTRYGYTECFGSEANIYLKDLLQGKEVVIEFDQSQGTTDKYNRYLAYIFYEGVNVNEEMIKNGYAWEYTYNNAYKYQDSFKEAQNFANSNKLGLWASNTCNGERVENETTNNSSGNSSVNIEDLKSNSTYSCGTKTYCTQMTTCEEAYYYLEVCGLNRLDGDGDGVPCENICR